MKKMVMSVMASFLLVGSLFASKTEVPTIPAGCFANGKVFCTQTDVVRSGDNKVIRVNLFAAISMDDYSSINEITEFYFDFAQWPTYAAGSQSVEFVKSMSLSPVMIDGKKVLRHYAYYYTKAPWPISRSKVREVAYYYELPPAPGAAKSIHFEAITNQVFQIPGEEELNGAEGLKYKAGDLHVKLDTANNQYLVFLTTDVIPSITLLPGVAAPYVEAGIVAVFKGMFGL